MTCRTRNLVLADQIVQRTLEIIAYFYPSQWFIENPKTGLLKSRFLMKDLAHVDLDYCQFSDWGYQKPTRIWGPSYLRNLKPRVCDIHTCPNVITRSSGHQGHRRILGATPQDGAPRVCLDDQYRIPEGLIRYIMGWDRVPTDWILPPIKPGDFNPKPPAQNHPSLCPQSQGNPTPNCHCTFDRNGENHWDSQRIVHYAQKENVVMKNHSQRPRYSQPTVHHIPTPVGIYAIYWIGFPCKRIPPPSHPVEGHAQHYPRKKGEDRPKSSPLSSMVRTLLHPRHFVTSTQIVVPQLRVTHQ